MTLARLRRGGTMLTSEHEFSAPVNALADRKCGACGYVRCSCPVVMTVAAKQPWEDATSKAILASIREALKRETAIALSRGYEPFGALALPAVPGKAEVLHKWRACSPTNTLCWDGAGPPPQGYHAAADDRITCPACLAALATKPAAEAGAVRVGDVWRFACDDGSWSWLVVEVDGQNVYANGDDKTHHLIALKASGTGYYGDGDWSLVARQPQATPEDALRAAGFREPKDRLFNWVSDDGKGLVWRHVDGVTNAWFAWYAAMGSQLGKPFGTDIHAAISFAVGEPQATATRWEDTRGASHGAHYVSGEYGIWPRGDSWSAGKASCGSYSPSEMPGDKYDWCGFKSADAAKAAIDLVRGGV